MQNRERTCIALLVAFTLTVQLPNLARSSYSGDEYEAARIGRKPLSQIVSHFQRAQNHPLLSILGHFAMELLPVPDRYALRLPAFAAGSLMPLVFYLTHRRWCGRDAALVVAALLVIADPVHYYATAGRGYTMLVLGVVLMNHLLLRYLAESSAWYLLVYALVGAVAAYAHLWTLIVIPGHAVFAFIEWLRGRDGATLPTRRLLAILAAFAATLALVLLLYLPMLDEIRSMAGHGRASRLQFALTLGDAVLQLARFEDWTLAAYVLLVPVVAEGLARKLKGGGPVSAVESFSRDACVASYLRLHAAIIVCALASAWWLAPVNFFSRFLLGIVPSGAALIAWALSGHWTQITRSKRPLLPRGATLLVAVALGTLVSNASITMDIPETTAFTDQAGRDHNYFYRSLPKALATSPLHPVVLLAAAVLWIALREKLPRFRPLAVAGSWLCTAFLIVSLPPLLTGPYFFAPRLFYEVHLVATAILWLFAWQHRHERPVLHALRWGLVATLGVTIAWRLELGEVAIDLFALLRAAAVVPAALLAITVARTSEP